MAVTKYFAIWNSRQRFSACLSNIMQANIVRSSASGPGRPHDRTLSIVTRHRRCRQMPIDDSLPGTMMLHFFHSCIRACQHRDEPGADQQRAAAETAAGVEF